MSKNHDLDEMIFKAIKETQGVQIRIGCEIAHPTNKHTFIVYARDKKSGEIFGRIKGLKEVHKFPARECFRVDLFTRKINLLIQERNKNGRENKTN